MNCDFCKKTFSSKSNLAAHVKTAKYCLEMQGKRDNAFECEYCSKVLSQKATLLDHLTTCKERYKKLLENTETQFKSIIKKLETEISKLKRSENETEKLKEKIQDKDEYYGSLIKKNDAHYEEMLKQKNEYISKLEARLDKFETAVTNMAAEPKTTKTTNVVVHNNNTLNLSTEHVTKMLDEHFTKDIAAGGQKRLAQMVCEKMLTGADGKLTYKCVDPSRHTFEFINDDGDIERDVKAKKLTKALINSNVQQKAAAVGNQIWTKDNGDVDSGMYDYCAPKVLELACLDRDDSKFRSELSALTSQ